MVWEDSLTGGFTTGRPWLPVKPPQRARNVAAQEGVAGSVLETYRALLAHRRASPALRKGRTVFHELPEPLLAFTRGSGADALTCVFNLRAEPQSVATPNARLVGPSQAAGLKAGLLKLGANGFAFLASGTGRPVSLG
jgi:alpha-glucosidase